jgi:hypothetical protein
MSEPLNHHAALVYVMVTISAVDRAMTDDELHRIGEIVSNLPVFDYDDNELVKTAEAWRILSADGGPAGAWAGTRCFAGEAPRDGTPWRSKLRGGPAGQAGRNPLSGDARRHAQPTA